MSFSDLFDSEFKSRNKGHFSSIVRVAFADGTVSPKEQEFLNKLADKLDITESEYEEILENPYKYPINPPHLYSHRLERLYDLGRMVHTDHHLGDKQDVLLRRFALALGFTPGNVDHIVNKAMSLIDHNVSIDEFMFEMEHMNK